MGGLTFNIGSLGMFADMMATGIARTNATGQAGKFGEIAQKLSGMGVLEINIGSNGITGKFGMGGFDLVGSLYTFGKRMSNKAALESYAMQERVSKEEAEAAYWGYVYGDWTQENTAARISNGVDELHIVDEMADGANAQTVQNKDGTGRVITMKNTGDVHKNAITIGHESYRDGVVGNQAEQQRETFNAVVGHAGMAARMDDYGTHFDGLLGAEVKAYKKGDMTALMMDSLYNYSSDADYWKLIQREDGSYAVKFDFNHSLVDENGNVLVRNDMDEFDEDGNIIGHKKGMSYSASLGMLLGTYTNYLDSSSDYTRGKNPTKEEINKKHMNDNNYIGKADVNPTETYLKKNGFVWNSINGWYNPNNPDASIPVNAYTMTLVDLMYNGIEKEDGFSNFNIRDEYNSIVAKVSVPYGDDLVRYLAIENMVPQSDIFKAGCFKITDDGNVSMFGVSSTLPDNWGEDYPAIEDGTYAYKFEKHYPKNGGDAYDALRIFNGDYQNMNIKVEEVTGTNINNKKYRDNVPGFYFKPTKDTDGSVYQKYEKKYTNYVNWHMSNFSWDYLFNRKRTGSEACLTTYPSQYWRNTLPSNKSNRAVDGYISINRTLFMNR